MSRISTEMVEVIAALPERIQRSLKSFMEDNPSAYIYDKNDVVKAWLNWEGIVGYEDSIIALVTGVYKPAPPPVQKPALWITKVEGAAETVYCLDKATDELSLREGYEVQGWKILSCEPADEAMDSEFPIGARLENW